MYKKQTVHTINRKQKKNKQNHFDHSNQNERDRTKPCNLVDDATKLKAVNKKLPHTSKHHTACGM